jgi:hypothetical protein
VTDSGQAVWRALRASGLSAVAVALALAAHRLSGGREPAVTAVAQAVVVMAVVMGLLAGRRRTATGLLVGLGGAQLLLHQWFALATPGECAGHLATQYVPGVHLLPPSVLPWGVVAQTARACATTGDAGATVVAVALAGHAVAALLTGVLLTRGEALLSCAGALVLPRLPAEAPDRVQPRHRTPHLSRVRPGTRPRQHVSRRGPPVPLCAA